MIQQPIFVLVEPQLGENIGAVARTLLNCSFTNLRLVNPRESWPNPKAVQMAAGADILLEGVRIYGSTREAVADLTYVLAATARLRDMEKPVFNLQEAAQQLHHQPHEQRIGILFGPERAGLSTADLEWAHGLINIPLNPAFSSLNLAQAVLLVAYECWRLKDDETARLSSLKKRKSPLAPLAEMEIFFQHLEAALDLSGFLHPPNLRPTMLRNLRHLFLRTGMTSQEVQTFHGILTSFEYVRKRSQK